jgi:hypothetical protein
VGRSGEKLDGLVEGPVGPDVVGELTAGHSDDAEGRVDRAGPDGLDGRVGVEEGHDVELDLGVRAVEVAQHGGRAEPPADHVDAQRAAAGADGGHCPLLGPQQVSGMRQERLSVDGEPHTARGAGEQPHTQGLLQRGDAFGDGLLGDRQLGGGVLEPPRVRGGHEGAHSVEVHAAHARDTTNGCASSTDRLFDPVVRPSL